VDGSLFQTGVDSWHDFYIAVGSASAALLGLLFVGVSINLSSIAVAKRADVRTKADLAFSNLLGLAPVRRTDSLSRFGLLEPLLLILGGGEIVERRV
jgi:hypothetical protein